MDIYLWLHSSFLLIFSDTTKRKQKYFQPVLCALFLLIMLPLGLFDHNFFFTESYYSLSTLFQAITMDICYWRYNFMLETPPIKICCINILSSDHNIIISFRDNEPHQGLLFSFSFMNKFGYCQELMKLKGKDRRQHSDWLLREALLRAWQDGF